MRKLLLESVLTVTYGVACFMAGAYLMYIEGPRIKIELVGPPTPKLTLDILPIGTTCTVPQGIYYYPYPNMGYGKGAVEFKEGHSPFLH